MKKISIVACFIVILVGQAFAGEKAKEFFIPEKGHGQIGIMGTAGVSNLVKNYSFDDKITFGVSAFYDLGYYDRKIGFLLGWDAITNTTDPQAKLEHNSVKFGLRTCRFLSVGPVFGFSKDKGTDKLSMDYGCFVNVSIPFCKYFGFCCEYQYSTNINIQHTVTGGIFITVPTSK